MVVAGPRAWSRLAGQLTPGPLQAGVRGRGEKGARSTEGTGDHSERRAHPQTTVLLGQTWPLLSEALITKEGALSIGWPFPRTCAFRREKPNMPGQPAQASPSRRTCVMQQAVHSESPWTSVVINCRVRPERSNRLMSATHVPSRRADLNK